MTRPRTPFRHRFGYAVWLKHLEEGEPPGYAEIGRAVVTTEKPDGYTGQGVSTWARSDRPPRDFETHAPLAAALGVAEDWLIKEEGEPPRGELWETWNRARREQQPVPTIRLEESPLTAPESAAGKGRGQRRPARKAAPRPHQSGKRRAGS